MIRLLAIKQPNIRRISRILRTLLEIRQLGKKSSDSNLLHRPG